MCGLSSSTSRNDSNRYANIDFGFYAMSNGKCRIYESGSRKTGDLDSYSSNDLFVTYDNSHVNYYFNGGLKRSVPVGSGKRFFVYLSGYSLGKTITKELSFVPAGPRGSTGGLGQKGDRGIQGVKGATGKSGTNGTQGPKGNPGGTGPKGQKGATGAKGNAGQKGSMANIGNTLVIPRANTAHEGGEIKLQSSNGQIMSIDQYDHKTPGFRNTFRFFDGNPHTKVYASISEAGLIVNGGLSVMNDLDVKGRVRFQNMTSGATLNFHGNSMGAFAMDDVVYINGYATHNGGDTLSAWNMNNGMLIKVIEPSQNRGKSSVKFTGGYSWSGRHYADICLAETHNANGSKNTARNNETIMYMNAHSVMIRIARNRTTGAITTSSMKTASGATYNTWGIFGTFNTGKTYDSFLTCYMNPDNVNADDHIYIYKHDWTGSGWSQTLRYLAINQIPAFHNIVNMDEGTYVYCHIAGLNPYTGKVYIETIGDMSAMHTFQIDPGAKGSSQEWAEVLWNNISNTGSPKYGNQGKLIYQKTWKLPYVNEYTNGSEAALFGKRISFDPVTHVPQYIAFGGFGNDHTTGGTKVIPWQDAWT